MAPDPQSVEFSGTPRFEVLARLGAGGMGVVYKAHDRVRNTRVALKTLRTFSAEGILRFKNEFRRLQDIQHPNLVTLGELISDHGQWFFTMELIDGVDFISYVRPSLVARSPSSLDAASPSADTLDPFAGGRTLPQPLAPRPPLDDRRLRAALGQLGRGLSALHAAHRVHRDIKPSNILVSREGRVVVLDFGLAIEVGGAPQSEVNVVGTADYMAPEQAASRPVGPSADWYSVGVLLFEALTGQLPFTGAPLEVLIAKQRGRAPSPRQLDPSAPADLAALCGDLLRTDPAARPTGAEVLKRLGADDPSIELRLATVAPQGSPFVGRIPELQELSDAFQATREGRPVAVFVQGESGVGKSALVRRFVEQLRAEQPGTVILSGRCYERESVPYKALDGVIDALARYMKRLPSAEAAALLPLRADLLAQVFPVLRRVEAVAQAPVRRGGIDPVELRARVFAALRELLQRLTERHPLAVVIDDLQWADADSRALLAEVLHPPEAPPLLLVATVRQGAAPDPEALSFLTGDVRHLKVARLPPEEARELAAELVRRNLDGKIGEDEARAIADEAEGHPLFIDELVRHAVSPGGETAPGARLRLEDALWARICRLEERARQLLSLVTVAAGPLLLDAAARAMEVGPGELEPLVGRLRAANLARSSRGAGRSGEAVEAYHDRVREAMLLHLDDEQARALHQALARALEASERPDPQALCTHWRGAGDRVRAAGYAAKAAELAAGAFAFERAARLYRLSLELDPQPGAAAVERLTRLGEALATIGRGGDAALAYLNAAKQADEATALELQRRAGQQLLVSGHIDEGLAGLRAVLASVGLKLADTPRRALLSLIVRRARVRLRGIGFRERKESEVPPEELRRIDVCWSVAVGLAMVDTIRSADFQARHLLLALEAGEPYRVVRALALEGAFASTTGGSERAEALLEAAGALAQRLDQPLALGLTQLGHGVHRYLNGRWTEAYQRCEAALELFRERCSDVNWEVNLCQQYMMMALAESGRLGEMSRRVPQLRRSARERGDLYAALSLRSGMLTFYSLAADEPERAREEIAEGLAKWSQQGFQLQHLWELYGKVFCDLYVGDGRTGLDRITARWPVLARSQLLRIQLLRINVLGLRARACLATAERLTPGDPERRALIEAATRDIQRLERETATWSRPMARLLRAGVAASSGEAARATAILDEAVRGLQAEDMHLFAQAARRRRGELLGGDEGARLVAEADAWMAGEQIKNPKRMTALIAPGFPDGP